MANPQKENGYTIIANELLEAVYCGKFSASKLKILLFVFRYTYGYNRKVARLSNSFISSGTGIHEITVSKEIKSLIADNVIIEQEKPSFSQPRLIGINKNYESWRNCLELAKPLRVNKKPLGVSETAKRGVSETANQEIQNNKENNKEIQLSCSSDDEACVFFEKIWKLYPLKKGKAQVKISHKRELLKIGYDVIVKAITEYDKGVKDKQYLMYGGRFFTTGYLDYINTEREVKENDRETTDDYFANY